MGLNYENLTNRVRDFMLQELDFDVSKGRLYLDERLNEHGRELYEGLLREAIQHHDDDWLAHELQTRECLEITETRSSTPQRRASIALVPRTAGLTLAEGEFNRYYIRGLCLLAAEDGIDKLEIVRAKPVSQARSVSTKLIGKFVKATELLADLRTSHDMSPALGIPSGPNSGLSVRLQDSK